MNPTPRDIALLNRKGGVGAHCEHDRLPSEFGQVADEFQSALHPRPSGGRKVIEYEEYAPHGGSLAALTPQLNPWVGGFHGLSCFPIVGNLDREIVVCRC